ncbi:hypothetical protein SEA_CHILL_63 [Mycobacterium phage Chill]|nr:hypothetical protein PBI_BIGMAMA_59 [Mycobacterium phage BigMama]AWY03503.1 hypothetical protein ERK16_60 [Mycobacterium phage Erk16]AXC38553.1 hypothetical protein SEA_VISCONTI_62 [Mycobacterium phage Visconti]QBI97127.1 hypothetical protein SEA_CHILL_63 [Mycobacterium phage Chill]QBP30060.1 hypothetical protein SEA_WALDOWHY_63 [Mycobacterium phage WaldoWhy]QEA11434.1 hypothetical protein SEA_PENELOPE2018_61 [Mycobacterium phage Penelope2018]QFP95986.1 hypothetical protein SEA_HELPFUL_64 
MADGRRCACGCIMVWSNENHTWLCIHCDLNIEPQEYAS